VTLDQYLNLNADEQALVRRKCGTAYTWDEFLDWLKHVDEATVARWQEEVEAQRIEALNRAKPFKEKPLH